MGEQKKIELVMSQSTSTSNTFDHLAQEPAEGIYGTPKTPFISSASGFLRLALLHHLFSLSSFLKSYSF